MDTTHKDKTVVITVQTPAGTGSGERPRVPAKAMEPIRK
jgi:hypothetical protein